MKSFKSIQVVKKCLKNVKIQIFNCQKHHAFESLTHCVAPFLGEKQAEKNIFLTGQIRKSSQKIRSNFWNS